MNRKRAIEISIAVCNMTLKRLEGLDQPTVLLYRQYPCNGKPNALELEEAGLINREERDELSEFYSCALCAECRKQCWKCIAAPLWADWMTKAQVKKLVPLCVNSQTSPYRAFRRTTRIDIAVEMITTIRRGLLIAQQKEEEK